ncbi:hypothetical protein LCGC14_1280060 [marine sediment metagenome]|uniref:Uncharacterized protein n=1 Tax=marine sediment metagenome TaxID=412755 RepID=A0A0F9NYM5_9ZZZZ
MNTLYREGRKFAHLTSGTNILRATGESAWLHRVTVNTGATGTITVYNNGAASGGVVAVITVAANDVVSLDYDVRLDTGLTVVLSATMDITVVYE